MIPYSDFARLLAAIPDCADLDAYISEEGGSVPLDDAEQVIELLTKLWAMAHEGLTIKSIAAAAGMSCRALSRELNISPRTIENWSASGANARTAPTWTLMLIAYAALNLNSRE